MSKGTADTPLRAALPRAAAFFALWLILTVGNPADICAGIITAALAAWASLRLLPLSDTRVSLPALAKYALRFFRQSIAAGVDVARRALDPQLPLRTGFVTYPLRLSQGPERSTFCAVSSLLPGTLPVEERDNGDLLIHCLDVNDEVVSEMARDENLFTQALARKKAQ